MSLGMIRRAFVKLLGGLGGGPNRQHHPGAESAETPLPLRPFEVVLHDGSVHRVDAVSAAHARTLVCFGRTAASDGAIYDPKRRAFAAFAIHPSRILSVREAAHGHEDASSEDRSSP